MGGDERLRIIETRIRTRSGDGTGQHHASGETKSEASTHVDAAAPSDVQVSARFDNDSPLVGEMTQAVRTIRRGHRDSRR